MKNFPYKKLLPSAAWVAWVPALFGWIKDQLWDLGSNDLTIFVLYGVIFAINLLPLPLLAQIIVSVVGFSLLIYMFHAYNRQVLRSYWAYPKEERIGVAQVISIFAGSTVIATWGNPQWLAFLHGAAFVYYGVIVYKQLSWSDHIKAFRKTLNDHPRWAFWITTLAWAALHPIFPLLTNVHWMWISLDYIIALFCVWVIWWQFHDNPSGKMKLGKWLPYVILLIGAFPVGVVTGMKLQPLLIYILIDLVLLLPYPPIAHFSVTWLQKPVKGWDFWTKVLAALGIALLLATFGTTWFAVGIHDWNPPTQDQHNSATYHKVPPTPNPVVVDGGNVLDQAMSSLASTTCTPDYSKGFGLWFAYLKAGAPGVINSTSTTEASDQLTKLQKTGFFSNSGRTDPQSKAITLEPAKVWAAFNAYTAQPTYPNKWVATYGADVVGVCNAPTPTPTSTVRPSPTATHAE